MKIDSFSLAGRGSGRAVARCDRQVANRGCDPAADARPRIRHARPYDGLLCQISRPDRRPAGADEGRLQKERAALKPLMQQLHLITAAQPV